MGKHVQRQIRFPQVYFILKIKVCLLQPVVQFEHVEFTFRVCNFKSIDQLMGYGPSPRHQRPLGFPVLQRGWQRTFLFSWKPWYQTEMVNGRKVQRQAKRMLIDTDSTQQRTCKKKQRIERVKIYFGKAIVTGEMDIYKWIRLPSQQRSLLIANQEFNTLTGKKINNGRELMVEMDTQEWIGNNE